MGHVQTTLVSGLRFFFMTLLGSAAATVLESLGGTNIPPADLLLGFLTLKLLSDRDVRENSVREILPGRPGFWMLMTTIYAVLSAYFMPRLFAGQTLVYSIRDNLFGYPVPLEPAMSNLTQTIYFVADFVCFLVLCGYGAEAGGRRTLRNAALGCVVLNLAFAVLDFATYSTNTSSLLSFIRNANYAILSNDSFGGLRRVVGSFNEASVFGSVTLGYLAFVGTLWLHGIRPRLTATLSFLSLAAIILSTSSTAYVGLSIFLFLAFALLLFRALTKPLTPQMAAFLLGAPLVLGILATTLALNVATSSYISEMADTIIFNKLASGSGIERSNWNQQAIQVFFDTFGFGAGNGSLRTSSFLLAVLATLGIIGTLFFGLFFLGLFGSRRVPTDDVLEQANREAAKSTCLAFLIAASLSGGYASLGLPFFAFAALACARPAYAVAARSSSDHLLESPPVRAG
jgi:hypothetical protein